MSGAVVAYVACALIWGTTWFAIRVCIGAGGYPVYAAAALRFTLAALILGAIAAVGIARPGPRGRREWLWVVVAGLLNAVGYGLIYTAETRITGGLSAVIFGTAPIMMAVVGSLTGAEQPSVRAVAGAVISLIGIGAIYRDRVDASAAEGWGVIMVLCSVMSSTIYNIIMKKHAGKQHPLATNAVFLGTTAVALWAWTASVEREALPSPLPVSPTIALVYLGVVGSVLAFASYFYLIKRVRLMTLSTLVFIQPIIAMSADAVWDPAARHLGLATWIGAAVTLGGVILTVLSRERTA